PGDRLSVNAKAVSAMRLGLVMVMVSEVVLPTESVAEPTLIAMVGADSALTVRVTTTAPLGGAWLDVTPAIVAVCDPALVPVTLNATEHDAFPASVPPERVTLPLPAVAVTVPPHVLVSAFGFATTRPARNVSVKTRPVSSVALGLVMVTVIEVVPPTKMDPAPKLCVTFGGRAPAVTLIVFDVPVIEEFAVSVAVMVRAPAELSVAENEPVPLVKVELAGSTGERSLLVK